MLPIYHAEENLVWEVGDRKSYYLLQIAESILVMLVKMNLLIDIRELIESLVEVENHAGGYQL